MSDDPASYVSSCLYVVCCLLLVVRCLLFVVRCSLFVVCFLLFVVCVLLFFVRPTYLQIQGRMHIFRKNHQTRAPTALGLLQSNAVNKMLQKSWVNVTKGVWKVCFMVDLLYHKNFGPNVDVSFCGMNNTQRTTHNKQQITNNKQRTPNNKQQTTNNKEPTTSNKR